MKNTSKSNTIAFVANRKNEFSVKEEDSNKIFKMYTCL